MELVHAGDLGGRTHGDKAMGRSSILLARAICQEPEAIVLTSSFLLDLRHKLELLTILKDLVRENR